MLDEYQRIRNKCNNFFFFNFAQLIFFLLNIFPFHFAGPSEFIERANVRGEKKFPMQNILSNQNFM